VSSSVGPALEKLALAARRGTARAPAALRQSGGGLDRLSESWVPLLQAAVAAGLAWFIAHDVIGHETPIFAPIGALIILSNAPGRRTSRILATTLGAVIGIAIGDLVVSAMGTGGIEVAVVALLAMGVATVLGASPMLVTQAGTAAVLIATIEPPHGIYSSAGVQRLVDVLVGGGAAIAVSVLLPAHPLKRTHAAETALLSELSGTLDDVAGALDSHDADAAERALERARTLDSYVDRFRQAIELGEETARLGPFYRHTRAPLARQAGAAVHLELAVRNVRVLARAGLRAIELEPPTPAELSLAVRELGFAVSALATEVDGREDQGAGSRAALSAARRATAVANSQASMPVAAIVAQVRFIATDLLRAVGLERSDALDQVRQAD